MKNCPFCKKSLQIKTEKCPYCGMILIEKFNLNSIPNTSTKTSEKPRTKYKPYKENTIKRVYSYFRKTIASNHYWSNFKPYIPLVVLIGIIFFISFQKETSNDYKPAVSIVTTPATQNVKKPTEYISLANGVVLSKENSFFYGLGKLIIVNGTSRDAIVKLINLTNNKRVLSIYVKANNIYEIEDISNGNYKLLFNLGNDWDKNVNKFTINSSYEEFEDRFSFTTKEYSDRTEYHTYKITLNAVPDGKAKTDKISSQEFDKY